MKKNSLPHRPLSLLQTLLQLYVKVPYLGELKESYNLFKNISNKAKESRKRLEGEW